MLSLLGSLAAAAVVIWYPGFARPGEVVETVIDRGPILELVVRCPVGTAIITYSKLERVYCSPRGGCSQELGRIVEDVCR